MQNNISNNSPKVYYNTDKRNYTPSQIELKHKIKVLAIKQGVNDIYSGKKLSMGGNPPTVEHIISLQEKNWKRLPQNFDINSLYNWFPVGSKGNNLRGSMKFRNVVLKNPDILNRLLKEMSKLEKINTPEVNGKEWMSGLRNTLCLALKNMCSDVKTHELKMHY